MDWILVVDLGHLCLIDICCCLDFVNGWMRGQYAGLLTYFFVAVLVGLLLETCWVALVVFIYTTHEH